MFLIFLTLIASWKPVRDTMFVMEPDSTDTLWVSANHIWNASGTIDISGLTDSLLDSLIYDANDTLRLYRNGEIAKVYISGGGGTTDTIYVKYGDTYGSDGWLGTSDTLFVDTLWQSEARVDTLGPLYLFNHLGTVMWVNSLTNWKSGTPASASPYGYVQLNAAGDYGFLPIKLLADSVWIDSVAWLYYWYNTPPDADTMYFVYCDSAATSLNIVYKPTFIDTVGASEINKDTYGERHVYTINKGYKLGSFSEISQCPMMGLEYEKETGAGLFNWYAIIIYYTRFMRR